VVQRTGAVARDLVVFTSWAGNYSDSPRAIFAELRRRDAPYESVWVLNDPAHAPEGTGAVRPDSAEYLRVLGRAGYLVSNNSMPGYFRKRRATKYVQTWHGTPLKRIAFDVSPEALRAGKSYLRTLRRDVDSWDLLLSPNRFSTDVLRRAFRYQGPIAETGYPRNDLLSSPERNEVRARTRRELGVGDDLTTVLYAPTFRDNREFSLELDLSRAAKALGDDFVFLFRAHKLDAARARVAGEPRVIDVSGRDDIAELFLAADVLVTDYSSVMFDFAVTGKPILFFTYDLAEYARDGRGMYFDLRAEAPGPLLADTGEVVDALENLARVHEAHAAAYAAFRQRFCSLEDGNAAARVVDSVFPLAVNRTPKSVLRS
jgi:CDP-glycerol glycerophosphotransferase